MGTIYGSLWLSFEVSVTPFGLVLTTNGTPMADFGPICHVFSPFGPFWSSCGSLRTKVPPY